MNSLARISVTIVGEHALSDGVERVAASAHSRALPFLRSVKLAPLAQKNAGKLALALKLKLRPFQRPESKEAASEPKTIVEEGGEE